MKTMTSLVLIGALLAQANLSPNQAFAQEQSPLDAIVEDAITKFEANPPAKVDENDTRSYPVGKVENGRFLPFVAGAVIGAAVGAAVASSYAPSYYYSTPRYYSYDGPRYYPIRYGYNRKAWCASRFRSYDWASGTWVDYYGRVRYCG